MPQRRNQRQQSWPPLEELEAMQALMGWQGAGPEQQIGLGFGSVAGPAAGTPGAGDQFGEAANLASILTMPFLFGGMAGAGRGLMGRALGGAGGRPHPLGFNTLSQQTLGQRQAAQMFGPGALPARASQMRPSAEPMRKATQTQRARMRGTSGSGAPVGAQRGLAPTGRQGSYMTPDQAARVAAQRQAIKQTVEPRLMGRPQQGFF